ncbi:hypothetical protein CPC08DRAFT_220429 [Agrocybe pediades]|nr:hypothetical protein CPC08DRAFT_220429 [Agrocybe pediades]
MNPQMQAPSVTTRIPNPLYYGANAFLPADYGDPATLDRKNLKSLDTAADVLHNALHYINHKQRDVPDFEDMKAELEKPDETESLKAEISSIKQVFYKDMERFYDVKAVEYKKEIEERYKSATPMVTCSRMAIANDEIKDFPLVTEWSDQAERIRYNYLKKVLPLVYEYRRRRDDEVRRQQAQQRKFPETIQEFDTKPRDYQLRIAMWLLADTEARREKYMSQYNWAWMQCTPLLEVFKKDLLLPVSKAWSLNKL